MRSLHRWPVNGPSMEIIQAAKKIKSVYSREYFVQIINFKINKLLLKADFTIRTYSLVLTLHETDVIQVFPGIFFADPVHPIYFTCTKPHGHLAGIFYYRIIRPVQVRTTGKADGSFHFRCLLFIPEHYFLREGNTDRKFQQNSPKCIDTRNQNSRIENVPRLTGLHHEMLFSVW